MIIFLKREREKKCFVTMNTLKFRPTLSVQKPFVSSVAHSLLHCGESLYIKVNLMNRPFLIPH